MGSVCPGGSLLLGGAGWGRGRGALTFLHAWVEGPPRLALAVFEQSFPDWICGMKRGAGAGEGWETPGWPLPLACPAAAAKPGNASRKKEIRFPTEPGKLLNRNRKSRGLG